MGTLYIIGNGFDLHFGLRTSVSDFKNILRKKRVFDELGNAEDVFGEYGVDWWEFENSLAFIDLLKIEQNKLKYPNYSSSHEYDRDGVITDMRLFLESISNTVQQSLIEMVRNANENICNTQKLWYDSSLFSDAKAIISFNYTSTVEILFNLKIPILHIHGYLANNDELIFGYKNGKEYYESFIADDDYYVMEQKKLIDEFYKSLKKQIKIKTLVNFLNIYEINNVDKVVVLGHSMSYVDAEYMEIVDRFVNPDCWEISYYNNPLAMDNYSFKNKIKLFKW